MTQHNRNISQKAFNRLSAEDRELWELREQAARRDEHMNEKLTRGQILEAIDLAEYTAEDNATRTTLALLRKIFE